MNILRRPFRYREYNFVLWLIGINILFYWGEMINRNVIVYFSMIPAAVLKGWVWQFVSYMFVHDPGNLTHLIFNMLALFLFGTRVENRMGSSEFLLYYFVTGTLAGVFSFLIYLLTGNYGVFLMGASGALFAVELAYAIILPQSIIYVFGILPLKAPVMVLGFVGFEIFFMITGSNSKVAHSTHLAGFAFGWLYFLVRFGINPWKAMRR